MDIMIFAAWSEIATDDVNNSTAKSFRQEQCEARNDYQSDAKGSRLLWNGSPSMLEYCLETSASSPAEPKEQAITWYFLRR